METALEQDREGVPGQIPRILPSISTRRRFGRPERTVRDAGEHPGLDPVQG